MSPFSATYMGVQGHDHEMNDFSPEAAEAEAERDRSMLAELESATVEDDKDRIARDAMVDSLSLSLDLHDASEHYRSLSMIHSPIHSIRQIFDLMPRESEDDWANIASRMALIPQGLASYRRTLEEGLRRGLVVAKRQAKETAEQCDVWTGAVEGQESFFNSLVSAFGGSPSLRADLESGARVADRGIEEMARFLRESYIPGATERDAVGEERYSLAARVYNGVDLDLRETYEWGWEQLAWVESEMAAAAEKITPGQGSSGGERSVGNRPVTRHRGRGGIRRMDAGFARSYHQRAGRESLRHRRPGQEDRGADRSARRRARDVLHTAKRGLFQAGPNMVSDRRKDTIPSLERGLNRVPRGRAGSSFSPGHDGLPVGAAIQIPATSGRHVRPDRGLGAVRGATNGRSRLPGEPRLLPGNVGRAIAEVDSSHHRYRNAPGAGDTEKPVLPPRRAMEPGSGTGVHSK